MAKRRSLAEPESQNHDPFDADIEDLNLEDLNVDDLRVEEAPDDALEMPVPPEDNAPTRAPLGPVQIIVGAIQVILLSAVFFALMVGLGFGVVYAGQQLGIMPTRSTGESGPTLAELPTEAAPEVVVVPTETPVPVVTADPGCPQADTWWNSQQVQSNYTYFTEQVMDAARASNNIAALTEQMRIHRDFVDNFPADACLSAAKSALLKAFDATIAVARSVNGSDQAALEQNQAAETQAYTDLADALREVGVNLAPPAAG